MARYRNSWAKVLALVAINPEIMPQRSDIEFVKQAVPGILKTQPSGIYREVILTAGALQKDFAQDLGGLISAPADKELRKEILSKVVRLVPPVYF